MHPIYKPFIPSKSTEYAMEAISSTWISSLGKYIEITTEKLKEVSKCRYVILTNTGTAATHLVCKSLKKFKPGVKRVLVPSACYIAVYNSLIYDNNKWQVQCLDLDIDSWNMKIDNVNETDAIFAVHNLGNIINVPKLVRKYGCPVIEDNCEGFMGFYENIPAGSASLCSAVSFFGNKNITCGEGGAFFTNDEEIYKFALKIRGQGQTHTKYIHDELGYNYRMTNIQAAILLGQLENIEYIKSNKKRVFDRYQNNLKNIDGIILQRPEKDTTHSMWMFGVRFPAMESYAIAEPYFTQHGIETRPMFYSHKSHEHLTFNGIDFISNIINNTAVIFPSYPELTDLEIDQICDEILNFNKKIR